MSQPDMLKAGDRFELQYASGRKGNVVLKDQLKVMSGEGEIWLVDDPSLLAKFYRTDKGIDLKARADKLAVMLANPPKDPAETGFSIAWPQALIKRRGVTLGFVMKKVPNGKRSNFVYLPMARKKDIPALDWWWLHHAALNVAKVCRAIHGLDYVIGDLKDQNWLFDDAMNAYVIDTDSFQVRDPRKKKVFHCTVFTPDYCPPDAAKKDFRSYVRDVRYDYFSIAVLIYQLLSGQHPFTGGRFRGGGAQAEAKKQDRILTGDWLYGRAGRYVAVPSDLPFDVFHPALRALFRRCFDDGLRDPGKRPTDEEWIAALEEAIASLSWCDRVTTHVYVGPGTDCVWCARRRDSGGDIWDSGYAGRSQSYKAAKEMLQRKYHAKDELYVLKVLANNTSFRKDRDLATIISAVEPLRPLVPKFEKIRVELEKPRVDVAAVAALVRQSEHLEHWVLNDAVLSVKYRAVVLREEAKRALEAAVAGSPERNGTYALAAEKEIQRVFEAHKSVVLHDKELTRQLGARVGNAGARVGAMAALETALAANEEVGIADILGKHGPALATVTEYAALRPRAEAIARAMAGLARFIGEAKKPQADDRVLVRVWESTDNVGQLATAKRPHPDLANTTPEACYGKAKKRCEAADDLKQKFAGFDAQSGATIVQDSEAQIAALYADAEKACGPMSAMDGGQLEARAAKAAERLKVFTLAQTLAQKPPERDTEIAAAWRKVPDGIRYQLAPAISQRLAGAEAVLKHIDSFRALAGRQPVDEAALVKFADSSPDFETALQSRDVVVEGRTVSEIIRTARERVNARDEVLAGIRETDAAPELTPDGEREIIALWQRHYAILSGWTSAYSALKPRMDQAVARLSRCDALATAVGNDDDAGIISAWGQDELLVEYQPAQEYRDRVEAARRIAEKYADIEQRLVEQPDDDVVVAALGKRLGADLSAKYANAPLDSLGGKTIAYCVDLAESRLAFTKKLVSAAQTGRVRTLLDLAAAWEPRFDTAHPKIQPHAGVITRAISLQAKAAELRTAVASKQDPRILAAWNALEPGEQDVDSLLPRPEDARRVATAMRSRLVNERPFANPRYTLGRNDWLMLQWDWTRPEVTHALVLVGDRHLPHSARDALVSRQVTRDEFLKNDGVAVEFRGTYFVARIIPSILFAGEMIEGSRGGSLTIREAERRKIVYKLDKPMLGLGTHVLRIKADRPMRLPELKLVGSDGRVVEEWGETDTLSDGELHIDLDKRVKRELGSNWSLALRNHVDREWVSIKR